MAQDFGDDMENALLNFVTRQNLVSGTVYQGGNRVHLGFIGFMRGYTYNRWATFNQILLTASKELKRSLAPTGNLYR